MTKAIYPKALKNFLKGDIDMDGTVKIALVDTDAAPYDAADEFLSDIAAGVVASTAALTGKTFTGGVFASDDAAALGVSGAEFEALVFYIDTGTPSTSKLIAFEDEDIDGAPATPDGGNFTIQMPTAGWFSL